MNIFYSCMIEITNFSAEQYHQTQQALITLGWATSLYLSSAFGCTFQDILAGLDPTTRQALNSAYNDHSTDRVAVDDAMRQLSDDRTIKVVGYINHKLAQQNRKGPLHRTVISALRSFPLDGRKVK